MTANELISSYKNSDLDSEQIEVWCKEAVEFLLQQAKEIEELKEIVEGTIKQAFYKDDYYKLKAEYDLLKAVFKYSTLPTSNA